MKTITCEFVEVTSLVPENWTSWFWTTISESAPFSWGDNNRSLVCACDFLRHCKDVIDVDDEEIEVSQSELDEFFERLESLGATYIDLEN